MKPAQLAGGSGTLDSKLWSCKAGGPGLGLGRGLADSISTYNKAPVTSHASTKPPPSPTGQNTSPSRENLMHEGPGSLAPVMVNVRCLPELVCESSKEVQRRSEGSESLHPA